ncbi:MAG: hypothetical protein H0T76_18535 [Nannocystis sp.]|nr:hypothetical protein [Nannocystis sp.]MBA3548484.1 hypothetical protein [Nannocystis sp.]
MSAGAELPAGLVVEQRELAGLARRSGGSSASASTSTVEVATGLPTALHP